jgi:ATP/maltotriose-dependent transcriptional regulator MalT
VDAFRPRPFEPISRPRLLERLARAARYRLTLLIAPAGFGKTIAVREFLADVGAESVLYDADHDSTLLALARGIARAIAPHAPSVDVMARLQAAAEQSPSEAELPRLLALSLIESLGEREMFVAIDGLNAPLVENPAIRRFMVALIERSAPSLRWIAAARTASDLPVATWMAYEITEGPIDEAVLAFDLDEARAFAAESGIASATVDELHAVTQGWPTAFALAVRGSMRPEQMRDVAGDSRHRVFEYLAEQIFAGIGERERALLLATCVLPQIDLEVASALIGEDARELFDRVRERVPLISAESSSVFRYHELFRNFLEYQLRRNDPAAFQKALADAADVLERLGRHADALSAAARAGADQTVERLLERAGFDLLERGEAEAVRAGVALLVRDACADNPVVLSLRAGLEAHDGELARAIVLFRRSIDDAREPNEALRLTHRFARELTKRNDPSHRDLLAKLLVVLETVTAVAGVEPDLEASICGTLSLAHLMLDRGEAARSWIRRALATVERSENVELRASIYHQAAYVTYIEGDVPASTKLAQTATRLATEHRLFSLAARTYSLRYGIAMGADDAPDKALEHLSAMLECAQRAGDRFLEIQALSATADIVAERGDEPELRRIEGVIAQRDEGLAVQTTSLVPAVALRAAWRGDFQAAHDLVAESALDQPSLLRQARRWSEVALYAGAAGLRDPALAAISNALHAARSSESRRLEDRRRYAFTLAWCALASVVIGHTATANGLLLELERMRREFSPRTRALVEAVRAIELEAEIGSREPAAQALAKLRAIGYGGYARLFEVLPVDRGEVRSSIAQLTKAEIQVLRALARGGSSSKVAADLSRSVNTVNVHVKSIMRKLGCATRYEALAVAREHGLIA